MDYVDIFCMQQGQGWFPLAATGIFVLIRNNTSFLHHLKNGKYFQYFCSLFLDKDRKHNNRTNYFFGLHIAVDIDIKSVLDWHQIIFNVDWGAASESVNTAMNLFNFTAHHQSAALSLLSTFH